MTGGPERKGDLNGAPVEALSDDRHEIETIHLRQTLSAIQWSALAFVLFCGAWFAFLGDPDIGLSGAIILAFLAIAIVAKRRLNRGNHQAVVVALCVAMLVACLTMLLLQPGLSPTLAVTLLLAVAFALPYVGERALKAIMVAAWVSVIAVSVAGSLLSARASGRTVALFDLLFGPSTLAAGVALMMLVLWQFRRRLTGALENAHRSEERARYDATHDSLTGLPNRALLEQRISGRLSPVPRDAVSHATDSSAPPFAVLFLDLDRFKYVNDSLGHHIGDELLQVVARRLSACIRPREGDMVSRLGGDEFVLVLDGAHEGVAEAVATRIQEALKRPIKLHGHELYATASIGILPDCSGYETTEEVLRDADTAMFRAKEFGSVRPAVFEPWMRTPAISHLRLETDLRRALERDEFVVRYQPIVWLATGRVAGFETLIHWAHPERGLLHPEEFMPLAQETGLAYDLDRIVLEKSCHSTALWRQDFPHHFPPAVSIDLSVEALFCPGLADEVARILDETGLPGHALMVTLSEEALTEYPEAAMITFERLRDLSVRLAVGGFGTGRSSLAFLHRLPADALKIDRSFVESIGAQDEDSAEIVRTILTVAHEFGMEVVAEGVRTREQVRILSDMDCDYVQGPRFSRPLDANGVKDILAAEPSWLG